MIRLSTTTTKRIRRGAGVSLAALAMAACGSGSSGGNNSAGPSGTNTPAGSESASADTAGTAFSVANVSGLGQVLVDGRGYTVYVLTKPGTKNVPCTDGSGCTNTWPDLSLPDGTTSATAGSGAKASLLGSAPANGETYPTYNGYLLYEYAGDNAPGQANGEGIKSFGGTWYALNAAGHEVDNS